MASWDDVDAMLLAFARENEDDKAEGPCSIWQGEVDLEYGIRPWDSSLIKVVDVLRFAINWGAENK